MEFKICRVCLDRTATISVFDKQGDVQYCAKMMKCAKVVISETDGLPDSICEGCACELAASYEFAERCEASDRALRALDQLHAAGAATPAATPGTSPQTLHCSHFKLEVEIKPENDTPDGSELLETGLDDCFEIDDANAHDVQDDVTDVKKKKSNRHEVSKYHCKDSKKVLPKHKRKRKVRLKTGPIQCVICDRTLSCHSAYELHMRSHTKERPYTCDICKKSYSTKHIMKTHILGHYGIKENRKRKKPDKRSNRLKRSPYQCTTCGQMTVCHSAMEHHMRIHTGEKPFTCDLCGKKYTLKGTLQRHMQSRHPESHPGAQFICEHCGKIFHNRTNIITHMRVHTGAKPYQCPFCPERFRQLSSMVRHKRLHTGEKPFSCNICGRTFRDHSCLNKHRSVHIAEKKYNCHLCTKSFKRKEGLRVHIIRHSKEKPWVCSFCGLRVTSKGNLKTHTERMHSERSGLCTVCNKQFPDVAAHARVHTGERPFCCKICDRSYATLRSLSHHMSFKHRNAGKYKCALENCIRSFPTASMLEYHVLKAHTQSTPYVCSHCARGFMRPSDLSRHLKMNHSDMHTKVQSHYICATDGSP